MKRIQRLAGPIALVLVAFASVASATSTPIPNAVIIKTRIFNDCPTSTVTTVNQYPSLISIQDANLDCFGFANLHNWTFSADGGATQAVFDNASTFRFSADLVLEGTGNGEGGLRISPWWSPDVDGRFNVRTTDGEIACFGGRLPFYTFTGARGLHYVKGETIHLEMIYNAHGLSSSKPATVEYRLRYQGTSYTSGPLPFDQGNPAEDPPHGLWGMLNDGRVGGYVQALLTGGDPTAVKGTFTNIVFDTTPHPNSAVIKTRVFNDCPTSTVTTVNQYASLISIEDAGLDCFGFANLHNWHFSEDGLNDAVFNNNSAFRFWADLVIEGTGNGEGGLQIAPWWSPDVDGRFNVRTTDGEIACFGGRLPFYTFTGAQGLHYAKGTPIHLQMTYDPHGLSSADPATIQYDLVYGGTAYSSGPLTFDSGNPAEDPPYGLWGMLNDGRAGGYVQPLLSGGEATAVKATWTHIGFSTCLHPVAVTAVIMPDVINLKSHMRWATVYLTAPAPYQASDIDASTVTVNGVAVLNPQIVDGTLSVKVPRDALNATLSIGTRVPILVAGEVGGSCFEAVDSVTVRSSGVLQPAAGSIVQAGSVATVTWETPEDYTVKSVTLLSTFDEGVTWNVEARDLPNTGSCAWPVPYALGPARLAVVLMVSSDAYGPVNAAEVAESGTFRIQNGTLGVGGASVAFALRGAVPNPSPRAMTVSFSLPTAAPARLALYDVSGREVVSRNLSAAGEQRVALGANLAPGLYRIRLTQAGRSLTRWAVVLE